MRSRRDGWPSSVGCLALLLAGLSLGCDGDLTGPPGADTTGGPTASSSGTTDPGTGGTGAGGMMGTGGTGTGGVIAGTGGTGGSGGSDPVMVADFSLVDYNPNSLTYQQPVSPRDYLMRVSAWYFGHAT